MSNDIDHRFKHHPPSPEKIIRHTEIRAAARACAEEIEKHCPDSREKALAMTKIEEAMMWANAAIARAPG